MDKHKTKFILLFSAFTCLGLVAYLISREPEPNKFSKYKIVNGLIQNDVGVSGVKKKLATKKKDVNARQPSSKRNEGLRVIRPTNLLKPQMPAQRNDRANGAESLNYSASTPISYNGSKYQRLQDVYALKENYIPMDFKVFDEINGYKIAIYNGEGEPTDGALVVLQDTQTGKKAIFTGILRFQFYNLNDVGVVEDSVNALLSDSGRVQIIEDPILDPIKVREFQFNNYDDTMKIYNKVSPKTYPGLIKRVSIDLIQWTRKSN